jgi:pyruvate kinase
VALSFVQTAQDVQTLRRLLKSLNSTAKIIAKIETKAAVENIDEIINVSDAVMVARGDLAIETEPESVPIVQRAIIGKCREYGKISIVATQMLASMTEMPEPTRAEVSDVATSVIVGADAVMLSDETANGKYPIESIEMMKRIILYTEKNAPLKPLFYNEQDHSVQSAVSSAMITLAHQVNARAIVAETSSGQTARSIAAHRPRMPIFMVTQSPRVAQQLAIVYGGKSFIRPVSKKAATKLTQFLREQKVFKKGDIVVICSGKYPGQVGGTDTVKVRVLE